LFPRVVGNPGHPRRQYQVLFLADAHSRTDGKGNLLIGAPFAYFSAYKTANGYTATCHRLSTLGQPVSRRPNRTSIQLFQIISAGSDYVFAPAGVLLPGQGATTE